MNRFYSLAAIGLAVALLLGCTKFEEGPGFTLRTKKGRVANDWKVDRGYINDIEATEALNDFYVTFKRDGAVKFTYMVPTAAGDSTFVVKGGWDFINDEDVALVLSKDDSTITRIWHLTRLTADELFATEMVGTNFVRYELGDK